MSHHQTRRGEIKELQDNLASNRIDQKKAAVRKIIDAMTRGKDVSILFTDIVKNMETSDLELKKIIYLYIINYAKTHPELAILAINTFRKDSRDKVNPFLRALAVRTMGCIRVKQITEYLVDPLKASLKDEDSYVRKTAAICVAKLYDVAPELIEEQEYLGNAMVVSNTVAAMMQISENKGVQLLTLNPHLVQKLLTALNDCSEWGQIYLLDALSTYTPIDYKETENILERVTPRISHANIGVLLSAVRVTIKYLDYLTSPEIIRSYCRKMTSPLISLVNTEPELQYIGYKNMNLIIQKRPVILEKELKVFFCKFNDPIYLKLEKLDLMVGLANNDNIQQILLELKEYTTEVDVEFVRKAVKAIGRCAIKLEKATKFCVEVLNECLKSKVNFIVQEVIIVVRDIFRKYPHQFDMLLPELCDNLKSLDDPDAKASMIWIIGDYVDTIENADALLLSFIETFKEDPAVVQLQILTSVVKLFLLRPKDGETILKDLFQIISDETENPDLRDRGFIYLRLLTHDPEFAKTIVFAERPTISEQSFTLETQLLDKLVENIGTLSSVYKKIPETFIKGIKDVLIEDEDEEEEPEELLAKERDNKNVALPRDDDSDEEFLLLIIYIELIIKMLEMMI